FGAQCFWGLYPGTSGLDVSRTCQRTRAPRTRTVPGARDGIVRIVCGSVACGAAADLGRGSAERAVQGRLGLGLVVEQRGALDRAGGAGDGDLAGLASAVLNRGVVEQHAAGGSDVHVLAGARA